MVKKIDFFNKNNKTNEEQLEKQQFMPVYSKKIGLKTSISTKNNPKTVNSANEKENVTNSTIIPKRRGRRLIKILENDEQELPVEDVQSESKDTSAVILGLKFDPSKLKKISIIKKMNAQVEKTNLASKKVKPVDNQINTNNIMFKKKTVDRTINESISSENSDSADGMFRNDIPMDIVCSKCEKNEKALMQLKSRFEKIENKDRSSKSNKVYQNKLNFISYTTGKKITIMKTNIKCWWDSYSFNTFPCVLPELFHNGIYHVTGCFCSFNCAMAWNLYYLKDSKTSERKSLIFKLYREFYGLTADETIDIKEAPPKELLADYGGDKSITIEVYRRSFVMNKEYMVFVPPIKPINIIIEERNIDNNDNDDDDQKYVIKRPKPLIKKRSVITSMNLSRQEQDQD